MILADKDDIIRSTPPIIAKFVGQRVDNLRRWLIKQPGYVEHIY